MDVKCSFAHLSRDTFPIVTDLHIWSRQLPEPKHCKVLVSAFRLCNSALVWSIWRRSRLYRRYFADLPAKMNFTKLLTFVSSAVIAGKFITLLVVFYRNDFDIFQFHCVGLHLRISNGVNGRLQSETLSFTSNYHCITDWNPKLINLTRDQ